MNEDKYLFKQALRPFSFSVALVVCLTGILIAHHDGFVDYPKSALILVAGLLLQAGVNLINDYADLPLLSSLEYSLSRTRIRANTLRGLCCFLVATLIGVYLIYLTDLLLLLLCAIGLLGALGYTLEPINYKRRGLAVILVFWFMGVLMVLGAYYVLALRITVEAFYLSLPVSLFTSLLLLSNELRDYESDREQGIGTLTVRLGYDKAVLLYICLIFAVFALVAFFSLISLMPKGYWVLLSLPFALWPCRFLHCDELKRKKITPLTGRAFLVFGLFYCGALVL